MLFSKFLKNNPIKPGMRFTVELKNGDLTTFWIGDATPFHEPSLNDGSFGWTDRYLDSKIVDFVDHSFVGIVGEDEDDSL